MNTSIAELEAETSDRIIKRMMKEHDFSYEKASAIFHETLVFMHASAGHEAELGPSEPVDIGWHTFILYTREYADYCQRAFGFFLHHNPTDRDGESGRPIQETVTFMERHGITFDPELWQPLAAGCVGQGGGGACGTQIAQPVLAGCTERCSTNCK